MENTLENKAKFFALYWGVKCLRNELLSDNIPAHKVDMSSCKGLPQQYLELTPISQISDEDKEYLDALQASDFDEYGYWFGMGGVHYYQPHEVDYLRSRGYLLPWMGLSVEKLVEYGWVKLKKD